MKKLKKFAMIPALCLAFAMIPAAGVSAADLVPAAVETHQAAVPAPEGYTVNDAGTVAYKEVPGGYDMKFLFDGANGPQWMSSARNDAGFCVLEYKNMGQSVASIAAEPAGDNYIRLNYTVTAGSGGISGGSFAVTAPVSVGGTGGTINVLYGEDNLPIGLEMVQDSPSADNYGAAFRLYFSGIGECTPVSTWHMMPNDMTNGAAFSRLTAQVALNINNAFQNDFYTVDGGMVLSLRGSGLGMAYSWNGINLEPGESKTFCVYLGAGEFETDEPVEFDDVTEDDWFYDEVQGVAKLGLMTGTAERIFSPRQNIDRASVAQIIWRMEECPEPKGKCAFDDTLKDAWYSNAVAWGAEEEILLGTGGNNFEPARDVTRQELAVILFRYAQYRGCEMTAGSDLGGFVDAADVADWAKESMAWAIANGIIIGTGENELAPFKSTSRAEAAAMLIRFVGYAEQPLLN